MKPLNRFPNRMSQKIDCRNIDRMLFAKENLPRNRRFSIPTYSLSWVSQVIRETNKAAGRVTDTEQVKMIYLI